MRREHRHVGPCYSHRSHQRWGTAVRTLPTSHQRESSPRGACVRDLLVSKVGSRHQPNHDAQVKGPPATPGSLSSEMPSEMPVCLVCASVWWVLKTQRHISHVSGSFEKPREGKFPAKKALKSTRRRIVRLKRDIWGDSLLVRDTWSPLLSGWQKIPTGVPSRAGLTGTCATGSLGRSPAPHVAPSPHLPVSGQGLKCSGVLLVPLPLPHSLKLSCSPA